MMVDELQLGVRCHCALLAIVFALLPSWTFSAEPLISIERASDHDSIVATTDERFWAFQPPEPQTLPAVSNPQWPQRRIDHFILAALDTHQLTPSSAASRRTLIRRLSFDLTGLPPTLPEINQYLSDPTANATVRLVDRLLASPRHGERMASFWLSLVRYGENQAHDYKGFLLDTYPNAYLYRDWVISAFNDDTPYDQFVRLQIAADVAEGTESDNLVALSFLGLGPKYFGRVQLDVMADEWADGIETISRTFLGMTVACARCHDHKYDPISTQDYHALAGVLASTEKFNTHVMKVVEDKVQDEKRLEYDPQTLHIVRDREPRDLPIYIGGNVHIAGEIVPRGFLPVLNAGESKHFSQGSGRGELADAIVSVKNPVAARVIVNRIWDLLFGRPIVTTPSNFGTRGQRPSHPLLLDDLSVRFMANGWSLKWLIKELVLSATYQQGMHSDDQAREIDPANKWYWQMNCRKVPAEMWRDAVLAVTGELDDEGLGGPSGDLNDRTFLRRTLYSAIDRRQLAEYLQLFDYPNPNSHRPRRDQTISPLQKLYLLNHPFVMDRAKCFANQIISQSDDNTERICQSYELLFARIPTEQEIELGLEFLNGDGFNRPAAWQRYLQTLLTANEMFYLE